MLILAMIAATLRVSTPVLLAALGGIASERSGVVNIGLEGMMLLGAFGAAAGTLATGSPYIGLACGAGAGLLLAAVHAFLCINLSANQVVAGMGINLLAYGLTPVLCKILYEVTSSTPAVPLESRLQNAPLYLAWAMTVLAWCVLRFTKAGLWLAASGESPEALETAGIRVSRVRWISVLVSGALAGLGGAALSICLSSSFSRGITAGRGFIALAALIAGSWKPIPTAVACLVFGFTEALQMRLQGVVLWGDKPVPVQFIQILPYVIAILLLAGLGKKSAPPEALGKS
jgi:simple sugar transport system permease protein